MYISILFLMYQALLMLIVAYKINDTLIGNYNNTFNKGLAVLIVAVTVILTGVNITWIVFQFYWFDGCSYNTWFISISVVVGVLFYGLVFLRTRSDASILTSSFVFLYCLYLQWSAMSSNLECINN